MSELFELLWDMTIGRWLKPGPLAVRAHDRGSQVELTLENQGTRKLKVAAVQVHDAAGKRHFPDTDLVPLTRIEPGASHTVVLSAEVLRSLDCRRLSVMDHSGGSWEAQGYSAPGQGS